jgi:hypothetical protein
MLKQIDDLQIKYKLKNGDLHHEKACVLKALNPMCAESPEP